MFKKIVSLSICAALCMSLLIGCSNADILDEQVEDLSADYVVEYPSDPEDKDSVLDTLDLILEQYVSGLQKPAFEDIQQTTVDPADKGDMFQNVSTDCNTADDMKAVLLQALTNTEGSVEFTMDSTVFTFELVYDVIFGQITEEYMIETLGMQEYTVTMMAISTDRVAVRVDYVYFGGKYSLDEVKALKQQTLTEAKAVCRQLDLANKSTYDCVYAVNEYLCDVCVYPDAEPYSNESHTPYGALIEKSAVCEGYARAAQLLFELAGLKSFFVTGDTTQGGHAWNLVEVDGQYYQLDITWNDADIPNHDYFLVTDDFMALSRTWDRQKYPASAKTSYSK